jgi:hypothetical protein
LTQNPKTDTEEIRGKLGQKSGRGDEDDAQVPFSEADMNKAGYAALAAGKVSDAIIAFERNATQYIVVERVRQLVRSVASGYHPITRSVDRDWARQDHLPLHSADQFGCRSS